MASATSKHRDGGGPLPYVLAFLLTLSGAAQAQEDERPPRRLSEWGLFDAQRRPAAGVVPYTVNSPLFTDYAEKHRFVRLPAGTSAEYRADEPLAFPLGTVLVKTFAYPTKTGPERWLETRLLVRRAEGWVGLPYVWNEEQTEAKLKLAGARRAIEWVDAEGRARQVSYLVPNANQCKGCHERGKVMGPIGPTARNLNDGTRLQRWAKEGLLSGLPGEAELPRLAAWDDPHSGTLAERARAYLEANCAHCHDPKGPGNTSGLDLRASQTDLHKVGVLKTPVAAGRGAGGFRFSIEPGHPERSIIVYRMSSTDPGEMMPEVGRRLVHEEGIALVRAWIESLRVQ